MGIVSHVIERAALGLHSPSIDSIWIFRCSYTLRPTVEICSKAAALSFDLESGNEADEDRFMAESKGFLDKESASILTKPTPDHTGMLLKEGLKLKEMLNRNLAINEEAAIGDDAMEVDAHNHGNKKRKFPDEIGKGVELLESGLKVMGDGLSHWQHNQTGLKEIHDKILTHFSRLEDVISHLVRLTCDT